MKSFSDNQGRKWDISVTYGFCKRAKARLEVNLLEPEEDNTIGRLVTSASLMAEVIALNLEGQFEAQDLTGDDVLEAFDGKVLSKAREAFMDEWQDFFLQCRQSHRLAATQKMEGAWETAMGEAERRIKAADVSGMVLKNMSGDAPDGSA